MASYAAGLLNATEDPGVFRPTGPLHTPREVHTATLLPSRKVLVAGGVNGLNWLASAELFDPATGRWSVTGSLNVGRSVHTATLLPNGKVLVVGGNTIDSIPLASAELYDPATETWTTTGALVTARAYHTATLLPIGRVLVTGGAQDTNGITLASAELYDPFTGTWTRTGTMAVARAYHTATLLPNGLVLVAGGGQRGNANTLASAQLYNPETGRWTSTAALRTPRSHHTATLLLNGMVLVAGGLNAIDPNSTASSAELYDSTTGSWTTAGALSIGRYAHTATLLLNGDVLVTGGANGGGTFLASTERYDPRLNRWSPTASMTDARVGHTATLLTDGAVLVTAGIDLSRPQFLSSVELYTASATGTGVTLTQVTRLPSGAVQLLFQSTPGTPLNVYAATNLAARSSEWTLLGPATEISPGQFQFTDLQPANYPQRYFQLSAAPESPGSSAAHDEGCPTCGLPAWIDRGRIMPGLNSKASTSNVVP